MSDIIHNTIIAANHIYFCPVGTSPLIDRNHKPGDDKWVPVGIVDDVGPNNDEEKVKITAPKNFVNQTVREVSHTLEMKYDVSLKSVDNFVMAAIYKCDFGSLKDANGNIIFTPGSKASHEGWFKWMMVDPDDGVGNNKINGDVILQILDVFGSYSVDGYNPKNTEGATPTLHITQLYTTKNKGLFNRQGILISTL